MGRAPGCGPGCCGFESRRPPMKLFKGERVFRGRLTGRTWDFDSQNRGSNPRPGTINLCGGSGREVEGARLAKRVHG